MEKYSRRTPAGLSADEIRTRPVDKAPGGVSTTLLEARGARASGLRGVGALRNFAIQTGKTHPTRPETSPAAMKGTYS
jgi:hypothetical protein